MVVVVLLLLLLLLLLLFVAIIVQISMNVCFLPSRAILTLSVLTRLDHLNVNVNPDFPELERQTLAEVSLDLQSLQQRTATRKEPT